MERVLQLAGQGGGCGWIVLSLAGPVISSFRHLSSFQRWNMIWTCWFHHKVLLQGVPSQHLWCRVAWQNTEVPHLNCNPVEACYSHTTWTLVGQRKSGAGHYMHKIQHATGALQDKHNWRDLYYKFQDDVQRKKHRRYKARWFSLLGHFPLSMAMNWGGTLCSDKLRCSQQREAGWGTCSFWLLRADNIPYVYTYISNTYMRYMHTRKVIEHLKLRQNVALPPTVWWQNVSAV